MKGSLFLLNSAFSVEEKKGIFILPHDRKGWEDHFCFHALSNLAHSSPRVTSLDGESECSPLRASWASPDGVYLPQRQGQLHGCATYAVVGVSVLSMVLYLV